MEINPEHPVTKEIHDHWHKIAMILLDRLGVKELLITNAEVEEFGRKYDGMAILFHARKDGLLLKIITMEEAKRKAVQ